MNENINIYRFLFCGRNIGGRVSCNFEGLNLGNTTAEISRGSDLMQLNLLETL
jgi:hypothetical protein